MSAPHDTESQFPRFIFNHTNHGVTTTFAAELSYYAHAPHVPALTLYAYSPTITDDGQHTGQFEYYDTVTVNPPAGEPLFLLNPDTDIIVSHNIANTEVEAMLIDAGIIEAEPYTQVRTGMALNYVHAMTDKAIACFFGDGDDSNIDTSTETETH